MPSNDRDARFWDKIARKYASEPVKDVTGYERTIARTRQLLRPSDTVLELGCGTGTTALTLAPSVTRMVGSDVSGEMIAIAREKATAAGSANAEFVVASAGNAPWADGSFDAVLAFNLFHLITDRATVFAHVRRLLKPGGLFISKTACLLEMNPLLRIAIPAMQFFGKAPSVSFFSADGLEREIEAAGFGITERARHGSERKDDRIFLVATRA